MLVGAFNQEKVLVGAFSTIVKTDISFAALLVTVPLAAGPGCVTNGTQVVSLSMEQDLRLECSMAWDIGDITSDGDTESGHTGGLTFSWAVTLGNGSKEEVLDDEWTKDRANTSTLTLPYNRLVDISISISRYLLYLLLCVSTSI